MNLSQVGIGGGGLATIPTANVERILYVGLDNGVRWIDTAPSYGQSEIKIGNALGRMPVSKREEFRIISKLGRSSFAMNYKGVTESIESSIRNLARQHIDVLLIHSLPLENISDEVHLAVQDAITSGKLLEYGFSGDGEEITRAAEENRFTSLMCTINFLDLHNHYRLGTAGFSKIFVKRPLANVVWQKSMWKHKILRRPIDEYTTNYLLRIRYLYPNMSRQELFHIAIDLCVGLNYATSIFFGMRSERHLMEIISSFSYLKEHARSSLNDYVTQFNRVSGVTDIDWTPHI